MWEKEVFSDLEKSLWVNVAAHQDFKSGSVEYQQMIWEALSVLLCLFLALDGPFCLVKDLWGVFV